MSLRFDVHDLAQTMDYMCGCKGLFPCCAGSVDLVGYRLIISFLLMTYVCTRILLHQGRLYSLYVCVDMIHSFIHPSLLNSIPLHRPRRRPPPPPRPLSPFQCRHLDDDEDDPPRPSPHRLKH